MPHERTALIVVDVQAGFDDPWWGTRNNPVADERIESLVDGFVASGQPVVYVRHDSDNPGSPLHPDSSGNRLKPYLRATPDLAVVKRVNSSFHGEPDLHAWLSGEAEEELFSQPFNKRLRWRKQPELSGGHDRKDCMLVGG